MPIKPENKERYPKDWPAIRARILQRAGNRCEQCGIFNHAWGWRDKAGEFHYVRVRPLREAGYRRPPFELRTQRSETLHIIAIVLTISHQDHVPENVAEGNLKALCQRCHLRYDRIHADVRTLSLL